MWLILLQCRLPLFRVGQLEHPFLIPEAELYDPEEARVWLYSMHRLLDGNRPIDLIHGGHADQVLAVIESLIEGTYT
jgi:hypothetical protein